MGDKPDFTNCCGTTANKAVNLAYVQTLESYLMLIADYVEQGKPSHVAVTSRMAKEYVRGESK